MAKKDYIQTRLAETKTRKGYYKKDKLKALPFSVYKDLLPMVKTKKSTNETIKQSQTKNLLSKKRRFEMPSTQPKKIKTEQLPVFKISSTSEKILKIARTKNVSTSKQAEIVALKKETFGDKKKNKVYAKEEAIKKEENIIFLAKNEKHEQPKIICFIKDLGEVIGTQKEKIYNQPVAGEYIPQKSEAKIATWGIINKIDEKNTRSSLESGKKIKGAEICTDCLNLLKQKKLNLTIPRG